MGSTPAQASIPVRPANESRLKFENRLAIVALALLEGPCPQSVDGLQHGSLDERAMERLAVVPDGPRACAALEAAGSWPRSVMKIVVAVAVLLVATGLAAVVSSTTTISVPAVLVGTLGLQTLLLLAWVTALLPGVGTVVRRACAAIVAGPVRTLGSLREIATQIPAKAPEALGDWAARRRRSMEIDHAASIAAAGALALAYAPRRSRLAALVYGVWSNGAWIAANVLVLGMLSLRLLGSRNYTLHSGLLSPEVTREWVEGVTRVLSVCMPAAWLPDSEALARAAAEPGGVATDSWRWGAMLVASVAVFGLLPRVVALIVSLAWLPAARRAWRIPWSEPQLAATRAVVESSRPPLTVVARERRAAEVRPAAHAARTAQGAAPAIVRLGSVSAWSPGAAAADLGTLDARGLEGAEAIAESVRSARHAPVVVLVDLALAPRRGMIDYLAPVAKACDGACVAVLSEGSRLRRGLRADDMALVVAAWRDILAASGVPAIVELDAALRTSRSGAQLEALLSGHSVASAPAALLGRSFERIIDGERDLSQRVPSAADERRLLDSLGAIHGIDALTARAPIVCVLGDAPRAWWLATVDQARHAAGGGPGLGEGALGASMRRSLLENAALVAIELEYQGCGEVGISRRMDRARALLSESMDAHADGRHDPHRWSEALAGLAKALPPIVEAAEATP